MLNLSYGLKGKNIIVTGAAGGLGSSVAKSFAASGANLLLTDIDLKKKTLNRLSKSLKKKYNIKCHILLLDISNRDDVCANLEISINGFTKKIDCLVNCAAIITRIFGSQLGQKISKGGTK